MKFLLTLVFTVASLAAFSVANFTSDKTSGCPPLVVNFTDISTGNPTTWHWDFNNGNTSTLQNPSAVFLTSGIYKVKLIESNGTQTDSIIKTIMVFDLPVVNFTVNSPTVCLHDTLTFNSNITLGDAPITQYAWGFGNGVASSTPTAHYLYSQTGAYTITLVVQDSNGCTANLSRTSYVHVVAPPVAAFTASPTFSCANSQLVTFTNHSTGGGLAYKWKFDANDSSYATNPTFVYPQETTYATLFVTDSNGCTASAYTQISVATLTADFTAPKRVTCTGQKLTFINNSSIQGTSWLWDFGDGTTATSSSVQKTYLTPGVYTVKFTVWDGNCADSVTKTNFITVVQGFHVSTASFTADSTISCGPLSTTFTNTTFGTGAGTGDTYHWIFGDGDTSDIQNPSTTYTAPGNYTVTLVITDTNGCMITGTQTDLIQTAPPVANFSVASNVCLGSGVTFYNGSTDAQAFMWVFGDGDTSYLQNPTHTYVANGSYSVTLYAYNKGGCDTSITKQNVVSVSPVHVDFHVSSTFSPCPPFVCLFTNASDPSVNKFRWYFGDGSSDTARNPTHIYFFPGTYTVTLIGHTPQGCIDTMVYQNLITVQGPTGTFNVSPTTGCIPLQVAITAVPSSSTQAFWCDLGDGTVIHDTANISHTYNQVRIFHPEFVLTDQQGCTVSYPLDSITTHASAQLTVSDTTVCSGSTVNMTISSDVNQILWSPDTLLSCSTCKTVSLTPVDTMVYTVTATNQYGCQTIGLVNVNTVALPILNDSVSARLCAEDSKNLFVGNASKVVWSPALYLSDSTIANPVCTPLASVNYTVTGYNSLGCSTSTQVPVTVKDKVAITLASNANVCTDGSVNLPVSIVFSSDLGTTYKWSKPEFLNDPTSSDPLASPGAHSEEFTVIVSSGHCIPDTQQVSVVVVPTPDIEVCSAVATTPGADVPLYAASHQQLSYQWFSKDSFSCADCRRTNLFPTQSQIVYVVGTNSTGCSVRDSVYIDVNGCDANNIFLPNTFTPNGDGLNDKFFIRTTTLSSLSYFRIFDRWGNVVFETSNLNEGWDGSISGKPGSTDTYVYMLEGKCQNGFNVTKTGNITAIR